MNGIKNLGKLKVLDLDFSENKCVDSSLFTFLQNITRLEELSLDFSSTKLNDDGIKNLARVLYNKK